MDLEKLMRKTFELANLGSGRVAPNPRVGAILVRNNQVISEGYHRFYGDSHAEVHAINHQKNLDDSWLFCNLEPCCHFGKTPPCTDLIISSGIKNVVISTLDPNPLVAGKGVRKLTENGINVITGILTEEGTEINKRFFTFHSKKRPYIILKFAQTKDKFIARTDFSSKWISSEKSRELVHHWRSEESGILVGTKTALVDNPSLTSRIKNRQNPVRIVIDKDLKLPADFNLFDRQAKTIIFNSKLDEDNLQHYIKLDFERNLPQQICSKLYEQNILSVIIEGGTNTISQFAKSNLWDEARIFTSDKLFGDGIAAPKIQGTSNSIQLIGEDILEFISPEN